MYEINFIRNDITGIYPKIDDRIICNMTYTFTKYTHDAIRFTLIP